MTTEQLQIMLQSIEQLRAEVAQTNLLLNLLIRLEASKVTGDKDDVIESSSEPDPNIKGPGNIIMSESACLNE